MDKSLLTAAAHSGRLVNGQMYSVSELIEALRIFVPHPALQQQLKLEARAWKAPINFDSVQVVPTTKGRQRCIMFHGLPDKVPAELGIWHGDNLSVLRSFTSESFDLIYIDPPFNTGYAQTRTRLKTVSDSEGDRIGFEGKRYKTEKLGTVSFADSFEDFMQFIEPRLREAKRLLKPNGSLFFHIDYREAHYCKVLLDQIFGRQSFMNEIVWAYDYGARSRARWSAKHDVIFWYANNPESYTFNVEAMDRIPYMAPGLVGAEKAARGKTPTDVWWHTIVPTGGKERTGYPTQKPLGILRRIISVHSNPGEHVLDFFAGSGTTGNAALELSRSATLVDASPEAMNVMARRLSQFTPAFHGWEPALEPRVDETS